MSRNKLHIIFFICFSTLSGFTQAQINHLLLNRENYFRYEADQVILNKNYDNQIKPFFSQDTSLPGVINKENAFYNKTIDKLYFEAEPLINFQLRKETSDNKYYSYNNVGGLFGARYKKLSFACKLDYTFNQPDSITKSFVSENYTLPHYRKINSLNNYSAFNFNFRLNWNVYKSLDLEIGNANNFIGEGYYSMFLSDNAPAYPYFKINTNFRRIKYQFILSKLVHTENTITNNSISYNEYQKYGVFHFFSIDVFKRFNIGIFEAVIWKDKDSLRQRGIEYRYINPLMFIRPVEYSIGSPDNILLGLSCNLLLGKNVKLYSQLMLDEFALPHVKARDGWWANKQALQAGIKIYNVMGVKYLMMLAEIDFVRPYTFSHLDPVQSYGHFNQSLAHPYQSNFAEGLFIVDFNNKKFRINNKNIFLIKGENPIIVSPTGNILETNEGSNMFLPYTSRNKEFDNYVGQGVKTTMLQNSITFGYYLFHKNYLVELGLTNYLYKTGEDKIRDKLYFNLGIRSYLY